MTSYKYLIYCRIYLLCIFSPTKHERVRLFATGRVELSYRRHIISNCDVNLEKYSKYFSNVCIVINLWKKINACNNLKLSMIKMMRKMFIKLCFLFLLRFPFDNQTCVLRFLIGGTMAHVKLEIRKVEFDVFCAESDEWILTNVNAAIQSRCSLVADKLFLDKYSN